MLKKIFFFIFLFVVSSLVSCFFYLKFWLDKGFFQEPDQTFYISSKSTLKKISAQLEQARIIDSKNLFLAYGRFFELDKKLKMGTYLIQKGNSPKDLFEKFVSGKTITTKVTLPEGFNIYQVSEKLSSLFPNSKKEGWLQLMADPNFIQSLHFWVPLKNLEGFLFPETYFFDPSDLPETVIEAFVHEFKHNSLTLFLNQKNSCPLDFLSFITLASIVEKEAHLPEERPLIAAVFLNRLKKKMRLQSDPTVIYGLKETYQGKLSKKDLQTPSAYNTYVNSGLPIGPIANPSLGSLGAVAQPADSDALYFVADGHGGHVFSRTLKEHNRAVRRYLKFLQNHRN